MFECGSWFYFVVLEVMSFWMGMCCNLFLILVEVVFVMLSFGYVGYS